MSPDPRNGVNRTKATRLNGSWERGVERHPALMYCTIWVSTAPQPSWKPMLVFLASFVVTVNGDGPIASPGSVPAELQDCGEEWFR
jgi:hypothetical protein